MTNYVIGRGIQYMLSIMSNSVMVKVGVKPKNEKERK